MCAGSQLRDTQGETLSVEGADISELEAGRGRINDNHGKGFFASLGRVTYAKKIFKSEDCEDDRQHYYWDKVKSPYIYVKACLYDNEDHPNARACAAILRNIHKSDCPLKIKASVEGGVIARGLKDESLLARTKIHSVALTFVPANQNTLVEPLNLDKSDSWETDQVLIKSVMHLVQTTVPTFRQITRDASATKIEANINTILELMGEDGIELKKSLIRESLEAKIAENVQKIHELVKMSQPGPSFPKLGVPRNHETPIVNTPRQVEIGNRAIVNAAKQNPYVNGNEIHEEHLNDPQLLGTCSQYNIPGESPKGYAKGIPLRTPGHAQTNDTSVRATKEHEDTHRTIVGVHDKFYPEKMAELSTKLPIDPFNNRLLSNMSQALLTSDPQAWEDYMQMLSWRGYVHVHPVTGEIQANHNEGLAYLVSYLNDPTFRAEYQKYIGPDKARAVDQSLKRAHRTFQRFANNADERAMGYLYDEELKPYLNKALTAGYGGAGSPMGLTGGGVMQSETLEQPKFKYITCDNCGKEQVYGKFQVKCRDCGKTFPLAKLDKFFRSK